MENYQRVNNSFKSINSTISNGAVYDWYLNAISAAYHTAVFEVIWPSAVSDLGVRVFSVCLVSDAADGIQVQPFSSWVMYVNAARGAQKLSSPLWLRAHSFSRRHCAYATNVAPESATGHWKHSERQPACCTSSICLRPRNRAISVATSQSYTPVHAAMGQRRMR